MAGHRARVEAALNAAVAAEDELMAQMGGHLITAGGKRARPLFAVAAAAALATTELDIGTTSIGDEGWAELLASGAPIDSFGVGTDLTTVRDAPALGVVYKLVELEEDGVVDFKMKLSDGKATWPARKQVWRTFDQNGLAAGDVISLRDDPSPSPSAAPLLEPILRGGQRVAPKPTLESLRDRAREVEALAEPDRQQ